MRLSHSALQDWTTCRYRWWLKYERRLRAVELGRAPNVGSAVHEGIAYFLRGLTVEEGVAAWREDAQSKIPVLEDDSLDFAGPLLDKYQEDGIAIAHRAIAYLGNRYETYHIDGKPAVEVKLGVPLDEPALKDQHEFVGVIDWIARDTTDGKLLLVDHKVRGSLSSPESEEVDTQKTTYMALLWMKHRLLTHGTASFQILSKMPREPKVNKNGTVSRTAITTDWETYERAVLQSGGNPLDYEDIRQKLEHTRWFSMDVNYRSRREVQAVWDTVTLPIIQDMTRPDHLVYRSMKSFNCMPSSCSYRQLCMADLKGYDVDYMLRFQYKVVDDAHSDTPDSELAELEDSAQSPP